MFIPRIAVSVAACFALVAACPEARADDDKPAPRRNVLLMIGDDHGLQLGCYGDRFIRTPHLDRLAAAGVRFTHAFATVSSCSPSRSVLFTGLHNHTNGQYGLAHAEHNFHTRGSVQSLPRLLGAHGYRTAVLGKLHVIPQAVYPFTEEIHAGLQGNRGVTEMADAARQFFSADDQPFLLVVGYADPHRAGKGFGNDRSYKGVEKVTYSPDQVEVPYFLPDRPEVRQDLADYYESISRLDQGVGLMLRALEESGRAEETLVIYLSDNGMPFVGAKTSLYDSGIRLPLIITSPTLGNRGLVNHAMVSWVDIAPTILHWAGAKPPSDELPGRSLLPILEQENPPDWDTVFASHTFHEITMYYPMRAVRTRRWKFIRNLVPGAECRPASDLWGSPSWQGILQRGDTMMGARRVADYLHRPAEELYDLDRDPNELKNLASDPKYADALNELRTKLRDFQQRTKDPWTVFDKY